MYRPHRSSHNTTFFGISNVLRLSFAGVRPTVCVVACGPAWIFMLPCGDRFCTSVMLDALLKLHRMTFYQGSDWAWHEYWPWDAEGVWEGWQKSWDGHGLLFEGEMGMILLGLGLATQDSPFLDVFEWVCQSGGPRCSVKRYGQVALNDIILLYEHHSGVA